MSARQQRKRKQQQVCQSQDTLGFLKIEEIIEFFLKWGVVEFELNTEEAEAIFGPDPTMSQDDEDEINMLFTDMMCLECIS